MQCAQIIDQMREIPAEFRPWPLFVFNEEHEGAMGEPRITQMLELLKSNGYGGVYIHPRPGLITEYLSPRWFELVRHTVSECRRLGLVPSLYDENSYPSGFAGGHVPSIAPDTRSRYVAPHFGRGPQGLPDALLALHAWDGRSPGETLRPEELSENTRWVAFAMGQRPCMAFHADTCYTSLCDPRTTEVFLQTTHEAYRAALDDEDWQSLGAIFTDEPQLPGISHGPWDEGLHLTPLILAEFERRRGYDLRPRLAELYFDGPQAHALRHDYYDLLHQLWLENWARPLHEWCREHGIPLTGHYLEHDWPTPFATPGQAHMVAHQDWPGTDFLECFSLLGWGLDDPQKCDSSAPGNEPQLLYYLRQVQSVAHQLDKERVLCESWGAGGHDSTPADWLRTGRFLAVHGVNHFCPHYTPMSIRGARKQDHPPYFSDHSPVFDYLGPLNEELSRLSWLATRGRARQRILMLDPQTTAFCRARKADCLELPEDDSHQATPRKPISIEPLRLAATRLAQRLSDQLLDFDIGDEYVLEEFGRVEGTCLVLGQQRYELLVWPEGMENLRAPSVPLIEAYLEGGGMLTGLEPPRITVDGRPAPLLEQWKQRFAEQLRWCDDEQALLEEIKRSVPPRLRFDKTPPTGLALLYRELDRDEQLYMLVNSHPHQTLEAPPIFHSDGDRPTLLLDPAHCRLESLAPGEQLRIPATESRVLLRSTNITDAPAVGDDTAPRETVNGLKLLEVRNDTENVLVVDHCELECAGQHYPLKSVYFANRDYWRSHGFENEGWLMQVQYRGHLLARDRHFGPESGGRACYRFQIDQDLALEGLRLAVESPEQWDILLNGTALDFTDAPAWRDPRLRALAAGNHLRHGENLLELSTQRFSVRQELDAIYLIGDLAAQPDQTGFRAAPASRSLTLGSWKDQGLPFYDGAVDYRFRLPDLPHGGLLRLPDSHWSGALVELRQASRIDRSYGPNVQFLLEPQSAGAIILRVVGLPKNLWGPWHPVGAAPRKQAWAGFWSVPGQADPGPSQGADYDLLDLGLVREPLLEKNP